MELDVRHVTREINRKKATKCPTIKSIEHVENVQVKSALVANSAQNPPPPMTRASYWDFMVRWRRRSLVTVPNAAACLVRLVHMFASVPGQS